MIRRRLTGLDFARLAAPMAHYWVEYSRGGNSKVWTRHPKKCMSYGQALAVVEGLTKRGDTSTRVIEVRP